MYYEPRLARVELPDDAKQEIDEFDDATVGAPRGDQRTAEVQVEPRSRRSSGPRSGSQLAQDIVTHWEARRDVLAGKAMVVTMSRRIAVDLYARHRRARPDWHSDDDAAGAVQVVITGNATDPASYQPHIRNQQERRAMKLRASIRTTRSSW
ncbi:MAG: hypothetical protein R2731_05830 [Nocardioides sp.]